jgi:hypothetical protein
MKTLIGAIALTLAVPAFAQTAPAADPHADHATHEKGKHDCKKCCEKMKQQGGKMECMDKKDEAKTAGSGQQADQAGHNHDH